MACITSKALINAQQNTMVCEDCKIAIEAFDLEETSRRAGNPYSGLWQGVHETSLMDRYKNLTLIFPELGAFIMSLGRRVCHSVCF